MRLRIASLMKLVAIAAVDFGAIACIRRGPVANDWHNPLNYFFGLVSVIFLLGTPYIVMASWPFAHQTKD